MIRTANFILLAGMVVLLLGCGLFGSGGEGREGDGAEPPVGRKTPTNTVAPPGATEMPLSTVAPISLTPPLYTGPTSLEERILASPVIARVQLASTASTVESAVIYDGSTKYIALLEFSFSVEEYLKGSGASDIVAVWAGPLFSTQQEAEGALPDIAAARDAQWDDREAIVFLRHSITYLTSTQQAGRFYLSGEILFGDIPDDYYSLSSPHNKLWLPAAEQVGTASQPTGDQQRFLMDVPPATGTAPTISLGEIKTRIGAVATKLTAGDGSEEYTECVQRTYRLEGDDRYSIQTRGDGQFYKIPNQELDSGLAASSIVYEAIAYGSLTNVRAEVWLDGGDADLFDVEFTDGVLYDFSGDGTTDSIQYTQRVVSVRPLPSGAYSTQYNNREAHFVPCAGYATRYEWTVTVNAPEGVLHEAFFDPVTIDPVTIGAAVGADSSNGVLKPTMFTDANGMSATLERIAWEPGEGDSGTVKLKLTPINGIANHTLDFIALDGSVPLSLKVADATVDAANRTLSWTVASQPWESGDLFMLRIREG